MNYSQYSNKDDAASATWPDPLWATGNQSYTSVPQSTHPDLISTSGYLSTAGPCVGSSTWTDPAVPQNLLDPWSMPALCMFLFLHLPRSFVFTGYESKVPDFNAPTTEMGALANLPTKADFTNPVSGQYIGTSTWTYPTVPQNVLDPWSMPGPCMFLSCICHFPSYSPDANPKPTSMRIPRSPCRNWLETHIGQGSIPLQPTRWLHHLT
jgi:hypothetical protein